MSSVSPAAISGAGHAVVPFHRHRRPLQHPAHRLRQVIHAHRQMQLVIDRSLKGVTIAGEIRGYVNVLVERGEG